MKRLITIYLIGGTVSRPMRFVADESTLIIEGSRKKNGEKYRNEYVRAPELDSDDGRFAFREVRIS